MTTACRKSTGRISKTFKAEGLASLAAQPASTVARRATSVDEALNSLLAELVGGVTDHGDSSEEESSFFGRITVPCLPCLPCLLPSADSTLPLAVKSKAADSGALKKGKVVHERHPRALKAHNRRTKAPQLPPMPVNPTVPIESRVRHLGITVLDGPLRFGRVGAEEAALDEALLRAATAAKARRAANKQRVALDTDGI
ncbi:unnamed protein product [Parajaminaea phylloscopi]